MEDEGLAVVEDLMMCEFVVEPGASLERECLASGYVG